MTEAVSVGPASGEWVVKTRSKGVVARFEDQERAVAVGIDRARAARPSRLTVRDEGGTVLMDRHYGEGVWPPHQEAYFYYELSEGSRPHEGTPPLEAEAGTTKRG